MKFHQKLTDKKSKKLETQNIKSEIKKADNQIDRLVNDLYGLTEEEIEIVDQASK